MSPVKSSVVTVKSTLCYCILVDIRRANQTTSKLSGTLAPIHTERMIHSLSKMLNI